MIFSSRFRWLGSLALIIGILSIQSCGSEKQTTKTLGESPRYTLVFLDKTQSVNVNKAFVHQKYRQALSELIDGNMRNKGDKLEVYFIHENTSKARALTLTVRSERESLEGANATDQEGIETAFNLSIQKEKGIFLSQLLTKLEQTNTGQSNQSTDILASIPVIAHANESGADVFVYYFSDMIESVKGSGRRDFHLHPPVSSDQAQEWAKQDLSSWNKYMIGSPTIRIISPFEPTASAKENNPRVSEYWKSLFSDLGASSLEEL